MRQDVRGGQGRDWSSQSSRALPHPETIMAELGLRCASRARLLWGQGLPSVPADMLLSSMWRNFDSASPLPGLPEAS